jgi:hypothetical protein
MEPPDSEESSGSDNFVHHPLMAMQARSRVFVTLSCLAGLWCTHPAAVSASFIEP